MRAQGKDGRITIPCLQVADIELPPEVDGLYDLQTDPHERHNLINVPIYKERVESMRDQLFDEFEASGALMMPIRRPAGERLDQRKLRR